MVLLSILLLCINVQLCASEGIIDDVQPRIIFHVCLDASRNSDDPLAVPRQLGILSHVSKEWYKSISWCLQDNDFVQRCEMHNICLKQVLVFYECNNDMIWDTDTVSINLSDICTPRHSNDFAGSKEVFYYYDNMKHAVDEKSQVLLFKHKVGIYYCGYWVDPIKTDTYNVSLIVVDEIMKSKMKLMQYLKQRKKGFELLQRQPYKRLVHDPYTAEPTLIDHWDHDSVYNYKYPSVFVPCPIEAKQFVRKLPPTERQKFQ